MVTLSNEDADFILRFLRADLELIEFRMEKLTESKKSLQKTYDTSEIKNTKLAQIMMDTADKISSQSLKEMQEIKNNLIHGIELLTAGSEECYKE